MLNLNYDWLPLFGYFFYEKVIFSFEKKLNEYLIVSFLLPLCILFVYLGFIKFLDSTHST